MGATSLPLQRPERFGAQVNTSGTFDVMERAVQKLETGHLYIKRYENSTSEKIFIWKWSRGRLLRAPFGRVRVRICVVSKAQDYTFELELIYFPSK